MVYLALTCWTNTRWWNSAQWCSIILMDFDLRSKIAKSRWRMLMKGSAVCVSNTLSICVIFLSFIGQLAITTTTTTTMDQKRLAYDIEAKRWCSLHHNDRPQTITMHRANQLAYSFYNICIYTFIPIEQLINPLEKNFQFLLRFFSAENHLIFFLTSIRLLYLLIILTIGHSFHLRVKSEKSLMMNSHWFAISLQAHINALATKYAA